MRERVARPSATIRCAIYTRKSTEEGLEQDFNSLDAQREACAAYILSQRHEGWALVPDFYDDGGYSGGTLERPGLKQLLSDVAAGKIDVIVLYKVDRLTRSLADFSKIVEVLDKTDTSFVSVTQAFNTTTSMGRLMLNVLLSFAQFEREVTGERIRDKVAASKKKGMWMGGPAPLGYAVQDRKLIIVPDEAHTVRHIFRRYLELGSGRQLVAELDAQGIRSKARIDRHGRAYGSARISRGALYTMLQNRLYVGEVSHLGHHYPGQHAPIVDRVLFDAAQAQLESARHEHRLQVNAKQPSLLAGLLFDAHGRCMSPVHSTHHGRRYRYYVSQSDGASAAAHPIWRVSSADIEALVLARVADALECTRHDRVAAEALDADRIELLNANVADAIDQLGRPEQGDTRAMIKQLITRIELIETELTISLRPDAIDELLYQLEPLIASCAIGFVRTRKNVKLLLPAPPTNEQAPIRRPALLKLVAQAFSARAAIEEGGSFEEVAKQLGYGPEYLADMIRTSYLDPAIITAIIDGNQPEALRRKQLVQTTRIPLDWGEQRRLFGFG